MNRTARTLAPAAVLGVAALALSACGGSDSGSEVEAVEVGGDTVAEDTVAGDTAGPTDDPAAAPGDDTATSPADPAATAADPATDSAADPAATEPATDDPAAAAGLPPRPERDRCVDLPEAPDGVYTVYEAGTATVTATDGRLALVDEQAAEGWTSRVDDQDEDEVQIDFRRDGSQDVLDLEVEVDDGRVEVQVCNDDD